MTTLNRHDAGQLLDYALRLRLAGHSVRQSALKKRFLKRATTIEKRALLLLSTDHKFESILPLGGTSQERVTS